LGDFQFIEDSKDLEDKREYVVRLANEQGFTYTGQILKSSNIKDGKGVLKYPDLSVFYGHFKNDKAEGPGRLISSGGDIYEGDWSPLSEPEQDINHYFIPLKAHFQGEGTYLKFNSGHYTGEWNKSIKHGYGKETFNDGSQYNGYFENGNATGEGVYIDPEGKITESLQIETNSDNLPEISNQVKNSSITSLDSNNRILVNKF